MARLVLRARRLPWILWRALARIASGSAEVARGAAGPSYASYLAHFRSCHGSAAKPLSRREFQQQELDRRYRGVSRCC
jgi:uncharacterized short protein YbdD (DUF466 family)